MSDEHRSWQFSLRFLLLAVTLASLCLGGVLYIRLNATRWYQEMLRGADERQRIAAEREAKLRGE